MDYPLIDSMCILSYYSRRVFTNQEDTLFAIAGISRRISIKMKCKFFQGLPTCAFDIFLLFSGSMLRRRKIFPSYSWAGWSGSINIHSPASANEQNSWLSIHTWIIWYKRSPAGVINLIWDIAANEAFLTATLEDIGYLST
jgi:hypothetical protein